MLIDDSSANLKLYTKLATGITDQVCVQPFTDPNAALEWLKGNTPDLVISDYKMPGMSGSDFTRSVRMLPTCLDVPVVVVTAYADRDFRIMALEAGATDFLSSPVDYAEFQTRARNLLSLSRQQRWLRRHASALERELQLSERSRDQLLRESREWLSQIVDTIPAMISASDRDGNRIFGNAYHTSLETPSHHPSSSEEILRLHQKILSSGEASAPFEETVGNRAGNKLTYVTVKSPLRNGKGDAVGVLTTSLDITARKRAEAQLMYQARHDHLTALPNRAAFCERLNAELSHSPPTGSPFALHLIDLDRFKHVNDGLGHGFGDQLLQVVAKRLLMAVREQDLVARLGGDEFAILQIAVAEHDAAVQLANRVKRLLLEPMKIDGRTVSATASIGITRYPADGQNAEELLQNADLAMYKVKADRGNGYAFFSPDLRLRARDAIRAQSSLRQALERNEFVLHYQPQIDLHSGQLIGAEALIRWQTRDGIVGPATFLPAANEAGLTQTIDHWVLSNACRQAKQWLDRMLKPVRVWVNVSPISFSMNSFFDAIIRELDNTGLPAEFLGIELTEEMLPRASRFAAQELERLHQLGVGISIDDFGAGHSSLARLTELRVDRLKIDGSFVNGSKYKSNDVIIRAVASLGHALNLEVLAEGVENADQLDEIRQAECDSVQGYWTGYPMDAGQFAGLLASARAANRSTKLALAPSPVS